MNMQQATIFDSFDAKSDSKNIELAIIMANDSGTFSDDLCSPRSQDNGSNVEDFDETREVTGPNSTGDVVFCNGPASNQNKTSGDDASSTMDVAKNGMNALDLKGGELKEILVNNNNVAKHSANCTVTRSTSNCDENNFSDPDEAEVGLIYVRRKKYCGCQGDNASPDGLARGDLNMHGAEDEGGYLPLTTQSPSSSGESSSDDDQNQNDSESATATNDVPTGPRDQGLDSGHDMLVNINGAQDVHIGTQNYYNVHVHIDGNMIQVLKEGNSVLVDLPENVKMRISIDGLDRATRDQMDEQIMEDLRDQSTGLLSTLVSGIQTVSSGLLSLFQVNRGCIEIVLVSQSKDAIEEFKKKIRKGQLTDELRKLLISENVKKLANGADFGLKIDIVEEFPKDCDPDEAWVDLIIKQIENKNIDDVIKMLAGIRTPNIKDENGVALMTHAAESGCVEILQLLKTKGGDVTVLHPSTRETLLHSAVRSGSSRMVEYVLPYCHPDQPIGDLYTSDFEGHETKSLIDINAFSSEDKTALQLAAEKGSLSIVKLLVGGGATSLLVNHTAALYCAPYEGIQAWLERVRRTRSDKVLECINDRENGLECLKKFWQAPYDHLLMNKLGESPLMYASRCSRLDIVDFLLESAVYEARATKEQPLAVNLNLKQSMKAEENDQDIDTIFIQGIKDLGSKTFFGSITSIDSGCTGDMSETNNSVTYVSHVRATDRRGKTALHYAIDAGDEETNVDIASRLLESDPSVINKQDKMGRTPLHIASTLLRKNVTKVLLRQKHVNVNLRDHLDWLADDVCPDHESSSIVKMIRKVRASGPRDAFSDKTSTNTESADCKPGFIPADRSILSRYLDDYGLNETAATAGFMDSGMFDPNKYQNMEAYNLINIFHSLHNKGPVKKVPPLKWPKTRTK